MGYYCKVCGCVVDISLCLPLKEDKSRVPLECPFCAEIAMEYFSEYETPEQFKKRTGESWPKYGPVWIKRNDGREYIGGGFWGVCRYKTAKDMNDIIVVCVQGPTPPPDNWKPNQ